MPAIDFTTAKKAIRSILQATRTSGGYDSTVDGSKDQFSSDAELDNAILYADAEICDLIVNTPGHPFQNSFSTTSSAMTNGATLPAFTGIVLKVMCLNGQSSVVLTSVDHTNDLYTVSGGHGLSQGQKVQISASVSLPTGLSAATDYWVIYVDTKRFKLASSAYNAAIESPVAISGNGSGTITVTPQYVEGVQAKSADECREMFANGAVYKYLPTDNDGQLNFWFIEGNILTTSAMSAKVVYTTYALTSLPQAPEPYFWAVVAGAVSRLLKDGGDDQSASYYGTIYQNQSGAIAQGARIVPAVSAYKLQSA